MKRIVLFFALLTAFSATAQEYKPFKVNLSVGYAKALGQGLSGGALVAVEPKYGLGDHVDLSLRVETAALLRGITFSNNNQTYTGKTSGFVSGLLTATYLFGSSGFRPFLGLGAGFYNLGESGTFSVTDGQRTPENVTITTTTQFGGMVRAGFKTGHFVAAVEYNAIPTTAVKLTNTTIDSKNAYLGIKIGFDIGGGRL